VQIRKDTQHEENRRNIENAHKHNERLKLMKIFEEEHPYAMDEIGRTISDLMEIEQADELQNVKFSVI
jgi:hypothetical protein